MAHDLVSRRAELVEYMGRSLRVRKRVGTAGGVGAALGIVLIVLGLGTPAWLVFMIALALGGAGVWITSGHIAEFRREIHAIDHPERDKRVRRVR